MTLQADAHYSFAIGHTLPAAVMGACLLASGIAESVLADSLLPQAYPSGGVLFGTPPEQDLELIWGIPAVQRGPEIIAEYELAGGTVRFIDERDSISTLIVGDGQTFRLAARAGTVGELFELAAPPSSRMPDRIAEVQWEPLNGLAWSNGASNGPTLGSEYEVGDDDWAEGCSGDAIELWDVAFDEWTGPIFGTSDAFTTTSHWNLGSGAIDPLYGFFGLLDAIWFGFCQVNGKPSTFVQMEYWNHEQCNPDGTSYVCGSWQILPGTAAPISNGERYLYHNHSVYSGLRRVTINPAAGEELGYGEGEWEFFISAAGFDTFVPDEQLQANE